MASLAQAGKNSKPGVGTQIPRRQEQDDNEVYLLSFERSAVRGRVPQRWAGMLAPSQSGCAQAAYFDLGPAEAEDYNKLKAEIFSLLSESTSTDQAFPHVDLR